MKSKMFKSGAGILLMLAMVSCGGISKVKIADIESEPGQYNDQRVKVKGEVVQTFALPFLGQSIVRLDDGTGKIWVKPSGKVPFKGEKLEVVGVVKVGMTFANKNFGFIVIEDEHEKNKR